MANHIRYIEGTLRAFWPIIPDILKVHYDLCGQSDIQDILEVDCDLCGQSYKIYWRHTVIFAANYTRYIGGTSNIYDQLYQINFRHTAIFAASHKRYI